MMDIDLPEVLAEVQTVFDPYEQALVTNDVPVLDEDRKSTRLNSSHT